MLEKFEWTEKSLHRNKLTDCYEPIQPFILHEAAERIAAATVFDVGANIGFYSVLLGTLPSVKQVHSFEPTEEAFHELAGNVKLNQLEEKCHLHNVALSEIQGRAQMNLVGECSGANALAVTTIHQDKTVLSQASVVLSTLDDIVANITLNEPIVIKVDVEGHELAVLKGSAKLLESSNGVIQIEIYQNNDKNEKIVEFLESKGLYMFFHAGPDHYFTNMPELRVEKNVITLLEAATAKLIESRLNTVSFSNVIRRRILPGMVVELSPRVSQFLKKKLKR